MNKSKHLSRSFPHDGDGVNAFTTSRPLPPFPLAYLAAVLLLCLTSAPLLAQRSSVPDFKVPVLEDVDPATVTFDASVIERDRSQTNMPLPGSSSPDIPAASGSTTASGGNSGSGSSGGYGSSGPSIFDGGPDMQGSSTGGNGGGGIDVSVSVDGQQIPGTISVPTLPGSGSDNDSGPSTADNSSDGGLDVNIDIQGGKQMPTLNIPGMPGMPGSSSGGSAGMPGSSSGGSPGMPGSSSGSGGSGGMPGGSTAGSNGNSSGMPGGSSGNGQGRDIAGNGSSSGSGSGSTAGSGSGTGSGTGSASGGGGQRSVLDRRLEKSFGVFDGMIIGERERAQSDADAAGSSVMGSGGGSGGEGSEGAGQLPGVIIATGPTDNSTGGGMVLGGERREGEFNNQAQSYEVPDDIPGGSDDDVVARQLREAAAQEADPELRKKLWDEYRRYTGLAVPE